MKKLWPLLTLGALAGCVDDPADLDPCSAHDGTTPVATLGTGTANFFQAFEPGDDVTLDTAPQGGLGVFVYIQTLYMQAEERVDVELTVEQDGQVFGTFLKENHPLYCAESEGELYGLLTDIAVGFDPELFPSTTELLEFDGEEVELVVTIIPDVGDTVTTRETVTIQVGG